MSRLYRAVKHEALADVIVSPERAAEITALEKAKGYLAFSHFSTFRATDERGYRGKFVDPITHEPLPDRHDFIVFNGQGVHHPNWGWGVVKEESDDGRDCLVLFFDELVWVPRQTLERIKYPKPNGATFKTLTDEEKGRLTTCPKCRKVKLLETVDKDGDIHSMCQSCSYVQVWKSDERMYRERQQQQVVVSQARDSRGKPETDVLGDGFKCYRGNYHPAPSPAAGSRQMCDCGSQPATIAQEESALVEVA